MNSILQRAIPGGWAQREVRIAGHAFQLALPQAPDEFLNQLPETWPAGNEPLDPYWAQLWPAALTLAEAVGRGPWPPGTQVLELGCGIGLVGLSALARGYCVTFSDLVPEAVALALENAARNGFAPGPATATHSLVFDWRAPPVLPRFPVVVAADVLYDTTAHAGLLNVLEQTLSPEGECWIGDPGRSAAQIFVQLAADRGFAVRVADEHGSELLRPTFGAYQRLILQRSQ